jgi:transcriptional regulator with XRE-family HTH domain
VPAKSRSPQIRQLGRNIARLRSRANRTQEQIAERIGVSSRYYQSMEAGRYFPSLPVLVALRAALKCTWEEMFDRL